MLPVLLLLLDADRHCVKTDVGAESMLQYDLCRRSTLERTSPLATLPAAKELMSIVARGLVVVESFPLSSSF